MPELHIIDDGWLTQPWYNTGGTREKKYLISPDEKFYYFKKSEYKPANGSIPEKYYKYEFWSEIIAYEVGRSLGFNVLKYDIAIEKDIVGCICETMINSEIEELIEGLTYLQGNIMSFNPALKESRKTYTFQLIESTFNSFQLRSFFPDFIKMLVFDALIGNGDRHQENWAIICRYTPFTKLLHDVLNQKEAIRNFHALQHARLSQQRERFFSPLYDNGSSLGRELSEERISEMLDKDLILDYVSRGKSEIHWDGRKITHFEILSNLLNTIQYSYLVRQIIHNLIQLFNPSTVKEIIDNIDSHIPESHATFKIPNERKLLIYKIITLRLEKLRLLVGERL